VLLATAASASADTLVVSSSPSNPTGVTPITITASLPEATAMGSILEVIVNPAGQSCPADPSGDSNPPAILEAVNFGGAGSISSAPFTLEHGSYTVCGWLTNSGTVIPAQAQLAVANSDKLAFASVPSSVVDGATTPLSLTGIADVQGPVVYVTRKPAANGSCAANPSADTGTPLSGLDPATATFGSFSSSASVALGGGVEGPDSEPPGAYLLCAWLMDSAGSKTVPIAAPASATVTLVAPSGTLAYSLGGQLVSAGSPFSVTTSFSTTASDVTLYLDFKPLPASGRLCASTRAADRGVVKTITSTLANHRTTSSVRLAKPGVYIACAWLAWPHGTVDGPFPGRLVVAASHQRPELYYGVTSQKIPRSKLKSSYPIAFEAIDGQIINLAYFARYTCTLRGKPSSHPIYSTSFPAFGMSSATRFADTFVTGSDHASISGHRRRRRATGTLSESYESGGYTCRSGTVTFSARRG
jgi:hypothetical protein